MAQIVNLKIPTTTKSFYDAISAAANMAKVNNVIRVKYGMYIKASSLMSNVPESIIESFIFIESAGNETASTPYAVGLMQLSPATASDCLIKEKGLGRLSDAEAFIIKKYLGTRFSLIANVKPKETTIGKTFITRADLLKPEFNIVVGTILLGQLISEFTENGQIRLDKIAVIYNTGRFSSVGKLAISHKGTSDELIAKIPVGQGDYVKKISGVYGLMDTLT